MSQQTWQETLVTAQVDGSPLTAVTTATSILPAVAAFTLPANYFYVGRQLLVKAAGRVSTTTSGTLTLDFRLGTLASPIVAFNGGAMTMITSVTNSTWNLEMIMTIRAIGTSTSANLIGTGHFVGPVTGSVAGGAGSFTAWNLPATAPAVGTGFDSSIANVANLFATWSAAGNSITLHQYSLWALN